MASGGLLVIRRSGPNLIHRLMSGGEVDVYRYDSGGSNGLTFDLEGRLLMCKGQNRRVTRLEHDGSINVVAADWDGKLLNSPNDIVCRSDGPIYFTDPPFFVEADQRDIDFSGVFCARVDGTTIPVITELEAPNVLAFSPDESILYVVNEERPMHIASYDVQPDGSVTGGRIFSDFPSGMGEGVPDGMKVDADGRVYCTGPGGCWIWDSQGRHIGTIELPEPPANMAWGDYGYQTIFFTARTSVYSIDTNIRGVRPPGVQ